MPRDWIFRLLKGFGRLARAPARWAPWAMLSLALLAKIEAPAPIRQLELAAFDQLHRLHPRAEPPLDQIPARVVDIDEDSLARLGQWPWPRDILARLVDRLTSAGARVLVFDVVFAEPDRASPSRLLASLPAGVSLPSEILARLPDNDASFAAALARMPTVAGFALSDDVGGRAPRARVSIARSGPDARAYLPTHAGALVPIPVIETALAGLGALNDTIDPDGVERRVSLFHNAFGRVHPGLALEAYRVFVGGKTYVLKSVGASGERIVGRSGGLVRVALAGFPDAPTIPTEGSGAMPLHLWARPPAWRVPVWRVLDGSADLADFAGRAIFIGASATGLIDIKTTAFGQRSGVEVQAEAFTQMVTGDFLARPDWAEAAELSLMALLGAGLILLLRYRRAVGTAVVGLAAIAATGVAAWIAFAGYGYVLDPVSPALALVAVYATATITGYMRSDAERSFIRGAFARYLSETLVERLAADPSRLRLGGERREMSFMFTDIAGFTTLSEKLGPVLLAPILNEYFDGTCAVILDHGGMVNEFIGDAIVAFFGAPLDQPDHAERAIAAARAVDRFAQGFSERQQAKGIAFGATRIGVHTGVALVGNFGSTRRFKYAALGDVVNTASRIEGLNKHFGTRVSISGVTVAGAGEAASIGLRPIGQVVVKGKTEALDIFEAPPDGMDPAFLDRYATAYRAMAEGDPNALGLFESLAAEAPDDHPTALHLARLRAGETGARIVMTEK